MPNLSRRHLVTSAAALPALALPAFASEAIGPNHPDAELIALGDELRRVWPEYLAVLSTLNEYGFDPPDEISARYYALDWQTGELAEKIMAAPARTLAGLGVKAIVAIHASPHFWDEPFQDTDWDQKGPRALIEAVCSLTGLDVAEHAVRS
jgi:hypothetical protein